ncbi:hypothetical protein CVT25_006896 [Psilocybe cyanescens]|uniref:CFEM domain-containing protein n=1 Tax=Psilocybe cyanescens TaxID=93625 RepID=A0A409X639_PSICY|nr:hypothetical protein CVT25_006896 [Psilocybe cyanescens]
MRTPTWSLVTIIPALAFYFGSVVPIVAAQGSKLSQLPACANNCGSSAASASHCQLFVFFLSFIACGPDVGYNHDSSDSDAKCLCATSAFHNSVIGCSQSVCNVEDRNAVQGVMDTFCNGVAETSTVTSATSSTAPHSSSASGTTRASSSSSPHSSSKSSSTGTSKSQSKSGFTTSTRTTSNTSTSSTSTPTSPTVVQTSSTGSGISIGTGIPNGTPPTAVGILPTDSQTSSDSASDAGSTDSPNATTPSGSLGIHGFNVVFGKGAWAKFVVGWGLGILMVVL